MQRCNIRGTVVGMRTRVGDGAIIEDSVIMGSDTYQVRHMNTFHLVFMDGHIDEMETI